MAGPSLTLKEIGSCVVESAFTSISFRQCAEFKLAGKMLAEAPLKLSPPIQKIDEQKTQELMQQYQLRTLEQLKLSSEDKKKIISEDMNMGTQIVFSKLDQAQTETDPDKKKAMVRDAKEYMCMLNALSSHPDISEADKETIRQMNRAYLEQVRGMNLGDPSLTRVMDPAYNQSGPFGIMLKMELALQDDPSLSEVRDRFLIPETPPKRP